jgi:hypothetical protein
MQQKVTFAEAVAHFQRIGFEVTPGPRPGEVTLIDRRDDCISTIVWPQEVLQPIAGVSQTFRYRNALLRTAADLPSL